jgi:CheY-like chemotaxis protein
LLKDSSARKKNDALRARPRGAGQWVLLVDDEKSLIHIGREFLENLGYRVESTTSSLEALTMIESQPQRFAALITDQTMPELTGQELALKARSACPDLPVIVCTGQPRQFKDVDLAAFGIFKVIGKPDIFNELAETLASCLPPVSAKSEA